jgi:hypothetical protein
MTPSSLDFPIRFRDRYRDYVAILDLLVAGMHGPDVDARLRGLSVPLGAPAGGPGDGAGKTLNGGSTEPRARGGSGI